MTEEYPHAPWGSVYPDLLPVGADWTIVRSRCPEDYMDYNDANDEAANKAADLWDGWITGSLFSSVPVLTDREQTRCSPTVPGRKANFMCRGWKKAVGGMPSAGRCDPDFLIIETPNDQWNGVVGGDDWFENVYAPKFAKDVWWFEHGEDCVGIECEVAEVTEP